MLITTAVVPVVGRLADMFGRKNLYNAGFAVFTLGSLLAGLSQPQYHGWDLVLFREVQGFRRRSAINQQRCYSHRCFPARRIGFGLGVSQIAFAAGFLVGPVVGGILAAISWRWIFLISVPLGVFGILWKMSRLREPV